VRARAAYELKFTRGGRGPAFLAGPERLDRIEVLDLQSGEVVYLWDLAPRHAARVLRALREDLASMEAEEFVAAWRDAGGRNSP
jgi:hypothetical protein